MCPQKLLLEILHPKPRRSVARRLWYNEVTRMTVRLAAETRKIAGAAGRGGAVVAVVVRAPQ